MNIFATFSCPKKSAEYLDDKRVIKMILESAQMLFTALNFWGRTGVYKPTHINHPCSKWVRENQSNYYWLLKHFTYLCSEYQKRYNKTHKCEEYLGFFIENMKLLPVGDLTSFPNCTKNEEKNIDFKHVVDVHEAYRSYLSAKWKTDSRKPTRYGKSL